MQRRQMPMFICIVHPPSFFCQKCILTHLVNIMFPPTICKTPDESVIPPVPLNLHHHFGLGVGLTEKVFGFVKELIYDHGIV